MNNFNSDLITANSINFTTTVSVIRALGENTPFAEYKGEVAFWAEVICDLEDAKLGNIAQFANSLLLRLDNLEGDRYTVGFFLWDMLDRTIVNASLAGHNYGDFLSKERLDSYSLTA